MYSSPGGRHGGAKRRKTRRRKPRSVAQFISVFDKVTTCKLSNYYCKMRFVHSKVSWQLSKCPLSVRITVVDLLTKDVKIAELIDLLGMVVGRMKNVDLLHELVTMQITNILRNIRRGVNGIFIQLSRLFRIRPFFVYKIIWLFFRCSFCIYNQSGNHEDPIIL